MKPTIITLAVVKDGVVEDILTTSFMGLPADAQVVVIPDGITAKKFDLCAYLDPVFTKNPKEQELSDVETKKSAVEAALEDIKTDAELKAYVNQLKADVDP